ncbi:MAG: TrmH family RNA methyltransferase [Cyclonatronaceae bacterium]
MMHKLSDTRQPQGVLAVMCMPDNTASENRIDKLLSGNTAREPHFLLALDGVSDPGNVGTLYRSAAWFSAAGLLLGPDCAELYNPKVVRSTAGATGSLAVVEQALPALLKTLEAAGYHIMLLDLNASARSLYEVFSAPETRPSKVVMVIGNEAHGISEPLRQRFEAVFIPGTDAGVESLNAGVSGSIAMSFFHAAHHS